MPYLKIAYNTFYFYIYTCRLSVFRFFDQILLADRVLESLSVTESVFFGIIYFGRAKTKDYDHKKHGLQYEVLRYSFSGIHVCLWSFLV